MTPETEEVGEWISNRCLAEVVTFCLYSSPSIIRIIRSKRMRWAGHVPRMEGGEEEKKNVCRLLVGKPEGKRPLGRPRQGWVDNIKMDLGES
jgi:hypothetical protein